ncbi:hypothetical protein TWF694_010980 [Orbilia ellipsospora]|uniref:Uncharacterized protein n=1 Tax=Orbilia ellipsospora TaxID=2528407 RepID=A0AAV9X7Z5_9PEZI
MDSTTNLINTTYGYQPEIHYLVAGASGCGKTTFLERITTGNIGTDESRIPHKQYILTNSAQTNAPILNFHENECLDSNEKQLRPDVLILCFDIGNPDTLQTVGDLNRTLAEKHGADIPTLILGLKRDLRNEEYREGKFIDPMVGYKTAQTLECTGYMECSAVTEELIPVVVEDLVKKGLDVKAGKQYETSGIGNCCVQ